MESTFLVKKAQQGNQNAFVQLMKMYENRLYNIAFRLVRNEHDTADVLQETILIAYQRMSSLKKPKYFYTWICRILINQCNALLNKNNRFAKADIGSDTIVMVADNGQIVAGNDIENLVGELSPLYKIPLVLYYHSGFSINEISEILDEPVGTIKSRLSRGRKIVKYELQQSEGGQIS